MTEEKGKELRGDIKQEMWEKTMNFLQEVEHKNVVDVCWKYNDDGAIEGIEVAFENPLYFTDTPKEADQAHLDSIKQEARE